jgi:CubicO group peptidase (beta-lactamase class C family)
VTLLAPLAFLLAIAIAPLGANGLPEVPMPSNQPAADTLVGLWKAKRWFGPQARGTLVIERSRSGFTADMMGMRRLVDVEGEMSFTLPGGQGAFRGRLEDGGAIRGHWYPPRPLAFGGHPTPVVLMPDGPDRWTGEVVPFDDVFTFYLFVRERPDGTLAAFLRNTERDWGALIGVRRLERDGNVVTLMGKPPWETEEVELSRGSYDPESDILTLSFPIRGGTYDFRRDDDESEFYPRGLHPARYVYRPPLARDDGWPTGTLEEVGIDRAAAESFVQTILDMPMDTVDAPQIHGLLIARHGKLVLEEYFHGEHRDRLHDTRSASKSVTATLIGAAIEAGAPLQLSTPVYEVMNGGVFPADLEPRKRAMTLEHLLTMSSGYYCDDSDPEAPGSEEMTSNQTDEPDYYQYTLKVPMAFAPGDTAIYCSSNPNLALGVLGRATGEFALETFDRLIAGPMKIERYAWAMDPAGNPYGGGSAQFLPRDLLKFGQLMLDGGMWEGRRILAEEFVERGSSPLYRLGSRAYGYLWWSVEFPYGGGTVPAFAALGTGGQTITVVPALDLVIGTFGGSYASAGWRYAQGELIPDYILPAVR